jgi:hypothetical protein
MDCGFIELNVWSSHRCARMLKQQSSITIYYLPTKKKNFPFPFLFSANKWKFAFAFSVGCKQTEVDDFYWFRFLFVEFQKNGDGDMETSNGKRKPRQFSLICLPFAHCANGSLLFVRLLTKKKTEVICFDCL